jgi:hypothetical protein
VFGGAKGTVRRLEVGGHNYKREVEEGSYGFESIQDLDCDGGYTDLHM